MSISSSNAPSAVASESLFVEFVAASPVTAPPSQQHPSALTLVVATDDGDQLPPPLLQPEALDWFSSGVFERHASQNAPFTEGTRSADNLTLEAPPAIKQHSLSVSAPSGSAQGSEFVETQAAPVVDNCREELVTHLSSNGATNSGEASGAIAADGVGGAPPKQATAETSSPSDHPTETVEHGPRKHDTLFVMEWEEDTTTGNPTETRVSGWADVATRGPWARQTSETHAKAFAPPPPPPPVPPAPVAVTATETSEAMKSTVEKIVAAMSEHCDFLSTPVPRVGHRPPTAPPNATTAQRPATAVVNVNLSAETKPLDVPQPVHSARTAARPIPQYSDFFLSEDDRVKEAASSQVNKATLKAAVPSYESMKTHSQSLPTADLFSYSTFTALHAGSAAPALPVYAPVTPRPAPLLTYESTTAAGPSSKTSGRHPTHHKRPRGDDAARKRDSDEGESDDSLEAATSRRNRGAPGGSGRSVDSILAAARIGHRNAAVAAAMARDLAHLEGDPLRDTMPVVGGGKGAERHNEEKKAKKAHQEQQVPPHPDLVQHSYLVMDTSSLLCVESPERDFNVLIAFRNKIVIPWMVVNELDRLHKVATGAIVDRMGSGGGNGNIASRKNRLLALRDYLLRPEPNIVLQSRQHLIDPAMQHTLSVNDDHILACAMYFRNDVAGKKSPPEPVFLITEDRLLCLKARAEGIPFSSIHRVLEAAKTTMQGVRKK